MARKKSLFTSALLTLYLFCLIYPAAKVKAGEIEVTVDPRVELLSIVWSLTDFGGQTSVNRLDFPYREAVNRWFSPYRGHRAVRMLDAMSTPHPVLKFLGLQRSTFAYDAPPATMLYLSPPPALNQEIPFSPYLIDRAGGRKKLDKFLDALRDFAETTRFMDFYHEQQPFYEQIKTSVEKNIGDDVQLLEDYFGMSAKKYSLILVPLFSGGYGPHIEREDGGKEIYCLIGPQTVRNGLPYFGEEQNLRVFLWHEFGHSFVNPVTEEFRAEVNKHSALFPPLAKKMEAQAYGTWETTVNEHLIRAVTTRLIHHVYGAAEGRRALESERYSGFIYIEHLCQALEEYEANRDQYPSFVDFYPRFLDVFAGIKSGGLKLDTQFTGPINALPRENDLVLIVPTNEEDKETEEEIHCYVEKIQQRFFPGSPILTDKEALARDLTGNSLIVYGTMEGNLWLRENLALFPFRVEDQRVVAGETYYGSNLRLITIWPNPYNREKGVLIYTAQRSRDILDINVVFHGPTDYVIAEGTEVLAAEYYTNKLGEWRFPFSR